MQRHLPAVGASSTTLTPTKRPVGRDTLRFEQKGVVIFVWCFGFAVALLGLILGLEPLGALALLVVPLAITMWQTWPRIAIFLVILASFINITEWYPQVFGLNLKPELIMGGLAFTLVVFKALAHNIRPKITFVGWCLLAWVSFTALSAVNSVDPARSAILSLLIFLAVLPFFVMVNTIRSIRTFEFAFDVLFWVGVCEGIFGLVAWFVGQTINFAPFANIGASGYFVTNGTWMETNIWGDFLVATTMLFVAKWYERRLHWWFWPLAGLCVIGVLISQTRGAWLSLAACLAVLPLVLWRTKLLASSRQVAGLLGGVVGLIVAIAILLSVILAATTDSSFLQRRLDTFTTLGTDSTLILRLEVNTTAVNDFWQRDSILLGSGANGFQLAGFDVLGVGDDWVGNIFLGALYDGGLLGLIAFSLAIFGALWLGIREARRAPDLELKAKLVALVMGGFAIVFTGQSNNHSWLALVWIYFGLLVAGIRLARNTPPAG